MEVRRTVGRPRKSCDLCHNLKTRCSGEKTGCTRCVNLKRPCRWTGSAGTVPQREYATAVTNLPSAPAVPATPNESRFLTGIAGIPGPLVATLKDIYFRTSYNSHLLLHARRFGEALLAGTVTDHVVLSMCAWAANFYRDTNGRATLKEDGFMMDWATRAGRMAFANAEELHEDNMITHTMLSIFWSSQGQWRRSILHKMSALQVIQVLGVRSRALSGEHPLKAELRRRHFWSCCSMDCHSMSDLHLTRALSDPATIPLPWPDLNFEAGTPPESTVTLSSDLSLPRGTYASAMEALVLWTTTVSKLRAGHGAIGGSYAVLHELDEQVSNWWSYNNYKITEANFPAWGTGELPRVLMVNFLYHQTRCAIHATSVPLFCGIEPTKPSSASSSTRLMAAQVALDHARAMSKLASMITSVRSDLIGVLPSFVAYALYCACAIQIPFLQCSDAQVQADAQSNVALIARLLHECSTFWKSAEMMTKYIAILRKLHSESGRVIESEPRRLHDDSQLGAVTSLAGSQTSVLEFLTWMRQDGDDGYSAPGTEREMPFEKSTVLPDTLSGVLVAPEPSEPYPAVPMMPEITSLEQLYPFTDPEMMGLFSDPGTSRWTGVTDDGTLFQFHPD